MAFLRKTISVFAGFLAISFAVVNAQTPPPGGAKSEYALKAVFLYNFCRFIEWPKSAFSSPNEPIIIGIVGDDPFGALLDEAIQGESQHGRSIRIEHYRKPEAIGHCHLLFVGRSEAIRLDAILAAVSGKSIVTVGETDAFLDRGGMIALTSERNHVRVHLNPEMLRAARLDVSSKLLRIAEIKQ